MKLLEAGQIHVQIMRFARCINMALNSKKPNLSPELFALRRAVALTEKKNRCDRYISDLHICFLNNVSNIKK